jgi:Putative lumazine-binding
MRKYTLLLSLMFVFVSAKAQTDTKTILEIETVCTYYLGGGTNGDSILFSKAFHPAGQMLFMRNDTLQVVSLKDFMARIRNTGQKANRSTKIESIQVFGDAAVAKLTIKTETAVLHDFMSLLKTKEGWKIVGKIFSREQKN